MAAAPKEQPAINTSPTTEPASQPLVLFLHVPRTAGTTVAQILARQYPRESILARYDSELGEELAHIGPTQLNRLRVLMGHFYFGVHSYLQRPATYVTILRDPIARTVSHYWYARNAPAHHFHEAARTMSLARFVDHCSRSSREAGVSLGFISDNDQTRQLAGRIGIPGAMTPDDELLDTAKRNMDSSFAAIGVTEQFDRTVLHFMHVLGWDLPFYTRQNRTSNRLDIRTLSQDELATIRRHNELDVELHRHAQELLTDRTSRYGRAFEYELRRFPRLNALHAALRWAPDRALDLYRTTADYATRLVRRP